MSEKYIWNPEGVHEDIDESILSHNLVEMRSSMMHLLTDESIGGNAGKMDIGGRTFSCAAARGFADAESGKIIAFGNYQDIPENIRGAYPEFIFRMAVDFERRNPFFRIVECSAGTSFTSQGKKMLQESMERWNSMSVARTRAALRRGSAAQGTRPRAAASREGLKTAYWSPFIIRRVSGPT